ncbi:SDR family NAD(P)-dependent oxidoreductase [Pontibacter diazotrophicus]|uniref:SDR family NAD(P)-dependent oxidoreductase n=1 Tax=Pontibacter diazotrophicus TaxID=1400979 RepID=A0A3D8L9B3_9BACT|nr:SDR family oxidoreductase [Pontibacter diazotrophicus]RDV14001.1 SDR family NAD(P)-dependent oxidoreductase [Pontibacter diazotrophicus]
MGNKDEVSIMGCGWLGLPLAAQLVKAGYKVKGSTTTPKKLELLEQKGIHPYLLNLQDEQLDREALKDFLKTQVLVLNIPPHLRSDGGEGYLEQMHLLLEFLSDSPVSRILFVSSTSVYLDLNRVVTEEDIAFTEEQQPDHMLLQAEKLFQENDGWLTTILRFGGLVGEDRRPGRFLAGKKNVPNGDAPVNLIHLEDCLTIIHRLIEGNIWGHVFHACADKHPLRKEFYTQAALALRLTPPEFKDMDETRFKLINSQKIKDALAYNFLHPDPMGFF